MTETPKKAVHWAPDFSISPFGSPFSDSSTSSSPSSSSSIQYINSQLVAHGFTIQPGLSFEGLSNAACDRIVKCLLAMLSQRVEDMSRTEDLATKLRTLSYDHDRLISIHRAATELAANAERETQLHKSRLVTANRSLQAVENAHKHTTAELQRTRASLQAVRLTHQSELKKKEKEVERIVEKWSKLADAQAKLSTTNSGLLANVAIVQGSEMLCKGQGYLETALEEAEQSRSALADENTTLRHLILTATNQLQAITYDVQSLQSTSEEPAPFTIAALFPLSPRHAAYETLNNLLSALRQSVSTISAATSAHSSLSTATSPLPAATSDEIKKLQIIIDGLRTEIEQSHEQSAAQATRMQALFDQFAQDHRISQEVGEMSIELITTPAKDEECERLHAIKKQLDEERKKFTEAAIKFGKEKVALEAERINFLDEKRAWQVEMMLADLPPTPCGNGVIASTSRLSPKRKSPRKSPCKSPAKAVACAAGARGRTTRISRRLSFGLSSPSKVITPSYETELIPTGISVPPAMPVFELPPLVHGKTRQSLLPTSFVLPLPSPLSSLPAQPALLSTAPSASEVHATSAPVSTTKAVALTTTTVPCTPPSYSRAFLPTNKPLTSRIVHAYSPAKPSPLSRILMLASLPGDSDDGFDDREPENGCEYTETVRGGGQSDNGFQERAQHRDHEMVEKVDAPPTSTENQPQEKTALRNKADVGSGATTATGRLHRPTTSERLQMLEKGKGKSDRPTTCPTAPLTEHPRPRSRLALGDKENNAKLHAGLKRGSGKAAGAVVTKPVASGKPGATRVTTKTTLSSNLATAPGKVKGGARRVPVDSAEAPSTTRNRRGAL